MLDSTFCSFQTSSDRVISFHLFVARLFDVTTTTTKITKSIRSSSTEGDDAITEWRMDLHEERRKDMPYRGEGPKEESAKGGCHWTTIVFYKLVFMVPREKNYLKTNYVLANF
uniref:Uncharacterized protein n=1 Tax=Caenorhabditis japonica TaxID=281687 RepID=A0A8R1EAC2_CAEJA